MSEEDTVSERDNVSEEDSERDTSEAGAHRAEDVSGWRLTERHDGLSDPGDPGWTVELGADVDWSELRQHPESGPKHALPEEDWLTFDEVRERLHMNPVVVVGKPMAEGTTVTRMKAGGQEGSIFVELVGVVPTDEKL